jgi:hemoglobin-like flavoprotein
MLTPTQVSLVQASFSLVEPIADTAAELFYGRLFELDPSLRPLFRGSMAEQRTKLMQTLTVVIRGLDRVAQIVPAVQALGRRHAAYGVQPEHFDTVAAALLWTLETGLGAAFTSEVRDAWIASYTLLADVMKSSLAEAQLPLAA